MSDSSEFQTIHTDKRGPNSQTSENPNQDSSRPQTNLLSNPAAVKQVKNITIGRFSNDQKYEVLSGSKTVRHTSTQKENQDIRFVNTR